MGIVTKITWSSMHLYFQIDQQNKGGNKCLARRIFLLNIQQWQENPLKGPTNTHTAFQLENLLLLYLNIILGLGHFKCSDTLRHVSSIYPLLCNPHFSPDTNTTFLHWFVRIKDVRISNFFSIINPGLQFYRQIKYLALFIKKRGFLPYLL